MTLVEVVEMISNSSKIECIDLELEASEQQYGSEVAWQRRKFEHIQVQERQNNLNFLIGCREKMIQKFPMGFRFSPTDKELINHYLRLKIEGRDSEVDFIPEVDFYKYEPWHLPGTVLRIFYLVWFPKNFFFFFGWRFGI